MAPLIVLIISLATHFYRFGQPLSVVFDEVYYGDFANSYLSGKYFFDLHPPLVKLIYALFGKLIGITNLNIDWSKIGNQLPELIADLRIIPTIAGILLPMVIYAICRRLEFSKPASFLAAMLICLENSLLVQSRFILPDIIMLLFGFSSILFYIEYNRRQGLRSGSVFFALSTIAAATTLSVKWTGATFLIVILFMEIYRLRNDREEFSPVMKDFTLFSFKYLIISVIIYIVLFAIHFAALPYSGKGDAFMTQNFQKSLVGNSNYGNQNIKDQGFWSDFVQLNKEMFRASNEMTATHPYSSKWYTWPVGQKPVYYWRDSGSNADPNHSYIYLFGNIFIYWLGTFITLMFIVYAVPKILSKQKLFNNNENTHILVFLLFGYFINLLPFSLIGRVMFLYHYEASLIFSILAIAFLADILKPKLRNLFVILVIATSLVAFLYWSPISYGLPISDTKIAELTWITNGR